MADKTVTTDVTREMMLAWLDKAAFPEFKKGAPDLPIIQKIHGIIALHTDGSGPEQMHGLPIDIRTHEKTMHGLLDYIASFQFQTGVDPQVAMAFEYVAEALRRVWNDRNAI